MKTICPCPKLTCPHHGQCDKCTRSHLRKGFLNYCAFHTILPTLQEVVAEDPDSPAAKKLDGLLKAQLQAYEKLMEKHGLDREAQDDLLKKATAGSDS